MDLLRELGRFTWAVINNLAGYATGGILVALIWLWSFISTKPLSRTFGLSLAAFFLLAACFSAWKDQAHDASISKSLLAANTLPDIDGAIPSYAIAPGGANHPGSIITAYITLLNRGAPSVATNYLLSVRLKEGELIAGLPMVIPLPGRKLRLGMAGSKEFFEYDGSQAIQRRTQETPIPKGGGANGFLQAFFPDVRIEQVEEGRLNLKPIDVNNKLWEFESPGRGTNQMPLIAPKLQQ